ncbi:anthrone oxygenase family protein [Roseovarius sp.]|uniref:anthrone oxygenase family protein n=1 Tax=Roseovarius sp. TaxID=1486281 RepID=UPI002613AF17|nr:anthrone oxygenase family protein [Roseovarius sp.]MDM8168124.1 DUF1772 domain-containing protein [Roseovarius sp.]
MSETVVLIAFGSVALVMALVSGVFLGFSDFIMRSLRVSSPRAGIEAMQQINREVLSSAFVFSLLALAPVSLGLIGYAWFALGGPEQGWFIAGGAIYVVGTFLVTLFGNVPMNRRLDAMAVEGPETEAYWAQYAVAWTRWNHVRTAASAVAAAALLVGCAIYA